MCNAEFIGFQPRGNIGVGFGIHIGVDADANRRSFAHVRGDFAHYMQLGYAFHIEAMDNKEDTLVLIHHIKENNVQVGISIKPNTPVDAIQDYLSLLDVVLVMSVEPGFGGQSFKEIALDKIKDLATRRKENSAHYLIEVDGGINATTGKQCKDAGVDVLVAGSYVFNSDDYTQRITSLK